MRRSIARFALAPLFVAACSSATADGDDSADGGGACVETVTVLADLAAASPLGFAPAELLAVAAGEHSSPMVWGAGVDESVTKVSFGPEAGDATLTATITHKGGEARYIASKPKDSALEGPSTRCDDRVEVDVEVALESSGGALLERFVAPLRGTIATVAMVRHEIELADLGGALALTQVEPQEARVLAMQIELGISEGGLFGGASSTVEVPAGDTVGATLMTYATWPGGELPCTSGEAVLSIDGAFADFSGADALALIAAATPLQISWSGGEPVGLSVALTHDGKAVCGRYEGEFEGGPTGGLHFGADLVVASSDGKWMGEFPVLVVAEPAADGSLATAQFGIYAPGEHSVASADFAAIYGLDDPGLADYERASLSFSGTFTRVGGTASGEGTLSLAGVTEVPCTDPETSCPGDEVTELLSAVWGTP